MRVALPGSQESLPTPSDRHAGCTLCRTLGPPLGSGQQRLFEGKPGQQLGAGFGHHQLLFELHPFFATVRADEAFDAEHHAGHDLAVVARIGEIAVVVEIGVFAGHPAAMRREVIPVGVVRLSGMSQAAFGIVAKAHAGADDVDVVVHLFMGELVERRVGWRVGASGPRVEGAREIGVVAVHTRPRRYRARSTRSAPITFSPVS